MRTAPFYCTLPSFRDGYRLIRRIIERNGQSVFLMVCSLTDGKGRPLESREKLEVLSENLHLAIKGSLRRGDSFTKYSPSQFLILLVGTNQENCDLIFRRILDKFSSKHKSWKQNLEYYVSSVADVIDIRIIRDCIFTGMNSTGTDEGREREVWK